MTVTIFRVTCPVKGCDWFHERSTRPPQLDMENAENLAEALAEWREYDRVKTAQACIHHFYKHSFWERVRSSAWKYANSRKWLEKQNRAAPSLPISGLRLVCEIHQGESNV